MNFLSEHGHFQARMTGVADTSVSLRRTQFRAADDRGKCAGIARQIIAGKIQNSRNSLLRAARENDDPGEQERLQRVVDALPDKFRIWPIAQAQFRIRRARLRGAEGLAAQLYFSVFSLLSSSSGNPFGSLRAAATRRATASIACCPSSTR